MSQSPHHHWAPGKDSARCSIIGKICKNADKMAAITGPMKTPRMPNMLMPPKIATRLSKGCILARPLRTSGRTILSATLVMMPNRSIKTTFINEPWVNKNNAPAIHTGVLPKIGIQANTKVVAVAKKAAGTPRIKKAAPMREAWTVDAARLAQITEMVVSEKVFSILVRANESKGMRSYIHEINRGPSIRK